MRRLVARIFGGRRHAPALFILAFAAFLSFRLYFLRTGFYFDDWVLLDRSLRAGGLLDAARTFAVVPHLSRPLSVLEIPFLYFFVGTRPWVGQLILFLLEFAESALLYFLLVRLCRWRHLALVAALLAMLFPNRSIMHPWLATVPIHLAYSLTLTSLLLHLKWLKERRPAWLAASLSAYMMGVFSYEAVMFIPLMLAGGRFVRYHAAGNPPLPALRHAAGEILPYAAPAALTLLWQHLGATLVAGAESGPFYFSATHFFTVYAAAARCVTDKALAFCILTFADFFRNASLATVTLWLFFSASTAYLLEKRRKGLPDTRLAVRTLLGTAAAAFIGGYIYYALSGDYAPDTVSQASRHNNAGAWTGGLLLAAGLESLRRVLDIRKAKPVAPALLTLILAAFTWSNLQLSRQWALSWKIQKDILTKVHAILAQIPAPASVLLLNAPKAFNTHFDFDFALRASTPRADRDGLSGSVVSPRMQFNDDDVIDTWNGVAVRRYTYENLYLYDYERDAMRRMTPPPRGGP